MKFAFEIKTEPVTQAAIISCRCLKLFRLFGHDRALRPEPVRQRHLLGHPCLHCLFGIALFASLSYTNKNI